MFQQKRNSKEDFSAPLLQYLHSPEGRAPKMVSKNDNGEYSITGHQQDIMSFTEHETVVQDQNEHLHYKFTFIYFWNLIYGKIFF